MGTLFCWQIGAASMDLDDATSPSIATTPSLEISFFTTVEASPCLDWSSSVSNTSFLPNAPPAAFASSIASKVPLWDMVPNVASLPVSEAYSPTLMVSPPPPPLPPEGSPGLLQPVRSSTLSGRTAADPWRASSTNRGSWCRCSLSWASFCSAPTCHARCSRV